MKGGNGMKKFENPEIIVEKFEIEDVIATSGGNGDNNTNDDEI